MADISMTDFFFGMKAVFQGHHLRTLPLWDLKLRASIIILMDLVETNTLCKKYFQNSFNISFRANNGGFSSGKSEKHFMSNLRSYDRIRPQTRDRIDYFEWAQRKLTVKEEEESRQKAAKMRELVTRLSSPKSSGSQYCYSSKRKLNTF